MQQILEEAADLWSIDTNNVHPADSYIAKKSFIEGAKWMEQRMFTENMIKIVVDMAREVDNGTNDYSYTDEEIIESFEQSK